MLKEGDVIEIKKGMKVYADVPEHYVYANRRGSFKLTHSIVLINDNFDYLCGKYVVYKTAMDGGGCGHGPHDIYPDGHHVFCMLSDDNDVRIDFYQSGSFTAMLPNIKPIARAKRTWVMEDCE